MWRKHICGTVVCSIGVLFFYALEKTISKNEVPVRENTFLPYRQNMEVLL